MKVEINATPVESNEEKEYGKFDKWEIECAVDTLIKAEEIKKDKEKMEYVAPLLKAKLEGLSSAISSLKDLKVAAKKRINEIEKEY